VTREGLSREEATRALEDALVALLGPLQWARWRFVDERDPDRN
jgi:hypothetical protein